MFKHVLLMVIASLAAAYAGAEAEMPPSLLTSDLQSIVTTAHAVDGSIESAPVVVVAAVPAEPPVTSTTSRLVCQGTNPWWTLKIEDQRMEFHLSSYSPVLYSSPTVTPSLNNSPTTTNYAGNAQDGATINALVVDVRINGGGSCSDNVSGKQYEYSVYINRVGQILDGCCWMEK